MPLTKWSKKRASATAAGWTAASPRGTCPRGGEILRRGGRKSWLHADESKMRETSLPHFSYSHWHPKAFWGHRGTCSMTSFSPCHCTLERLSHEVTLLLAWNLGCLDTHWDQGSHKTLLWVLSFRKHQWRCHDPQPVPSPTSHLWETKPYLGHFLKFSSSGWIGPTSGSPLSKSVSAACRHSIVKELCQHHPCLPAPEVWDLCEQGMAPTGTVPSGCCWAPPVNTDPGLL